MKLRAQADALEVEITRLEAVADDQRNLPGTTSVEGKGVSNDELRPLHHDRRYPLSLHVGAG